MKNLSRRSFLENAGIGIGTTTVALALPMLITPPEKKDKPYEGKKLNIALCGLGNYSGYLAVGLETSQYCKLAGIVTGHPAKAEIWKKKYNIPEKNIYNYQNFDEIADDGFFELNPAVSYGPFRGRTSKGELNFPAINQQTTQLDEMGKLLLENK